jgi:hypothetical protein
VRLLTPTCWRTRVGLHGVVVGIGGRKLGQHCFGTQSPYRVVKRAFGYLFPKQTSFR